MNILVLGGTGAMGTPLLKLLNDGKNRLTVTSRSKHSSLDNSVCYKQGNAKNIVFIREILADNYYDVIVDFMSYSTEEFQQRYNLFLDHTTQYVFISSARVYAQSDRPITENTPRLLDVSTDQQYLLTDEYALAKARSENILIASGKQNFTIIRPSITYGDYRLQLGALEKENWLYRALHGRRIVFSDDIAFKYTAMTTGEDVARGIVSILGKQGALGQTFHITSEKSYTWNEILKRYLEVIEDETGIKPGVVMTKTTVKLKIKAAKYQVIYCRYFNRRFDNSKIKDYVDTETFTDPMEGLADCLRKCIDDPNFGNIDWRIEAWNDRAANEHTPLSEIPSLKQKTVYICCRYGLGFLIEFYLNMCSFWKNLQGTTSSKKIGKDEQK